MKNSSNLRVALLVLYDIFEVKYADDRKIIVTGGLLFELFELILRSLNVPFEILIPKDQEWGVQLEDGNWTGLVGMIARNEADIGFAEFYMTESRLKVVDYSYPFTFVHTGFATRKPGEMHSSFAFIYPFGTYVWIALISSLLCLSCTMNYLFSIRYTFQGWCFQLLGSIFKQPISVRSFLISDRLLLLSVFFGAFFISVSYSSVLLSFLSFPLREVGVKDVKTLTSAVKSKNMKVYALETNTPSILSAHPDRDIRYLMKEMLKNKWILTPDREVLSKNIFEKKNALIGSHFTFREMFGSMNYLLSEDVFSTFPISLIMRKNFKFKRKIDSYVNKFAAFGIYQKAKDHFFFKEEKHFTPSISDFEVKITMKKIYGVFIALLTGYILSLCALFVEIGYFHLSKRKINNNNNNNKKFFLAKLNSRTKLHGVAKL